MKSVKLAKAPASSKSASPGGPADRPNPWKVAQQQLNAVVDLLGYNDGLRQTLATPRKCLTVAVPIRMDDGGLHTLQSAGLKLKKGVAY